MGRFDGLVAIVTGSSSGIGRAALFAFAHEGASVTLHGSNSERIQQTEEALRESGIPEEKVVVVQGHIEDEDTQKNLITTTLAKFGRIDVLVNNAGVISKPETDLLSLDNFDFVFNINVRAPFRLTELVLPHLEKMRGNIVNVSSVAAQRKPIDSDYQVVYGMSKAAIDRFTANNCQRLARKGVRINNVAPGYFVTNIANRAQGEAAPNTAENTKARADRAKILEGLTPVGRAGNVDEAAAVILQLADAKSAFTTGATWVVDGGAMHHANSIQ